MLVTATAGLLLLIRHRLSPAFLSPVKLVAASYLALAGLGAVLYERVAHAPQGSSIVLDLPASAREATVALLLTAAMAFVAGAAIMSLLAPQKVTMRNVRLTARAQDPRILGVLLLGSLLTLILLIGEVGAANLVSRDTYLAQTSGATLLAGISGQLAVAAILILGFVTATSTGLQRLAALSLLMAYSTTFFALGTRRLALVPLVFALGIYGATFSRRAKLGVVAAALISLYMIRLPLFLRNQPEHGLMPYLGALPDFLDYSAGWDAVAVNILISFGTIGATAFTQNHFPLADLWMALNPLPGRFSGWYEVEPLHRFSEFTPYATVGELGNLGWVALVVYFLFVGVAFGYLDRRVRWLLAHGHQYLGLGITGLAGLFVPFSLQYNMRTSSRFVLYALGADLAIRWWLRRGEWSSGAHSRSAAVDGQRVEAHHGDGFPQSRTPTV